MRIIVVDDDHDILQLVSIHLTREGYEVEQASDAQQALDVLEEKEVDLAIVDVMMPGMNGFELTEILTRELDIPVILLTAKGQLEDKEKGFIAGSEDYIVKPFEPKELLFRVAVVLRRFERSIDALIEVGNLKIDRKNFEVVINQETIMLPMKEFELLSLLAARAHKIIQRTLLIEQTWGADYEGGEMTLNTHINRIRERLKRYGATVEIQTVRGIGYKLEANK
ncbi:response regulator transcription factor [Lysinibacillus odysseyi]|uniref:Heme response regulator HssR n=1 Tax=Lysinibacillus odysseyi 34hs-1 = NBRC 100172 TaxID=1220589 RepID=A0A0A3IMA7_9BACI|nr:response regulator transcription factor [Lysinibacillus odysseyi]KGR85866.1 heme transporter CcmC [Lysinibacillus odysseyi 34hs-1 = NBRC 100172]